MQGSVFILAARHQVGPGGDQGLDHDGIAVARGRPVQGRIVPLVPCLQIGAGLEQDFHHLRIFVVGSSPMQGRVLPPVPGFHFGAGLQQGFHDLRIPVVCGRPVQGRVLPLVPGHQVGPGLEQGPDHPRMLGVGGCLMQGREFCFVPRSQVGPGGETAVHLIDRRPLEILFGIPLLAVRLPKHRVRECKAGHQHRELDFHAFLPTRELPPIVHPSGPNSGTGQTGLSHKMRDPGAETRATGDRRSTGFHEPPSDPVATTGWA